MPSVAVSHKSLDDVAQLQELDAVEIILVIINHTSINVASTLTAAEQVVYMTKNISEDFSWCYYYLHQGSYQQDFQAVSKTL